MLLSLFAILMGLAVIVGSITFLNKSAHIRKEGVIAEGIVFDVTQSTMGNSSISNPIIRFTTEENEWVTEKSKIGVIPGMYKKGKRVIVIYQKDNPSNFIINDSINAIAPYIIIGIAISIILFGIYRLIYI